jgi:hypothetical protein
MNQLKRLGLGMGKNPLLQNIADYGTAAALGAVGQQAMNIVSPGPDPNPLVSGLLAAPLITGLGRFSRGAVNPTSDMAAINSARLNQQLANPIESRLLGASTAAGLSGLVTSGINSFTGGTDYDNNVVAANVAGGGLLGGALLAGLAPLSASLISKVRNTSPRPVV